MSSTSDSLTPVPVPRTGVMIGIADPVEQARAELKAALAAIEEKANVSRRVSRAAEEAVATARRFSRENQNATVAIIVGGAALIGVLVWGAVRAYTR